MIHLACWAAFGIFGQCKDDDNATPPQATAACLIQSESTNLPGNEATWQYEYTSSGFPSKITRADKFGNVTDIIEVFSNQVTKSKILSGSPTGTVISTTYEGDYLRSLPPRSFVSITMNGVTTVNYELYIFNYDYKGRLHIISQQTPNVANDLEWELTISYNDDDNVTKLLYELLTGPRAVSTIIAVDGYDDHPTPHAGVPGWKFLMYNYTWNNYDPSPIIAALSKNNPTHYTFYSDDVQQAETTMSYVYNAEGFPVQRTNTSKNENGESSNIQTFTYQCP
jgi:hypothetical protein